jgi:hypothetical protein
MQDQVSSFFPQWLTCTLLNSEIDLSTSSMESALSPLTEHLTCEQCRQVLTERIKTLVVQWSVVKVSCFVIFSTHAVDACHTANDLKSIHFVSPRSSFCGPEYTLVPSLAGRSTSSQLIPRNSHAFVLVLFPLSRHSSSIKHDTESRLLDSCTLFFLPVYTH